MDSLKGRIKIALVSLCLIFAIIFGVYYITRAVVYPTKYKDYVHSSATEYGISPSLVFAVIKAESGFDKKAVSGDGAKGLMQITDATAEYIAELLGEEDYDIFDAETNIRFGTFYLKYLYYKFGTLNEVLCAYNAGEGNVSEWLDSDKYSDDGKTLKKVPYKETSSYVTKVRAYMKEYAKILGKKRQK